MEEEMDELRVRSASGPYLSSEIPKVDIDYRGLVDYAHSVGKAVFELSDEEKERFVLDMSMDDVRRLSTGMFE